MPHAHLQAWHQQGGQLVIWADEGDHLLVALSTHGLHHSNNVDVISEDPADVAHNSRADSAAERVMKPAASAVFVGMLVRSM